MSEEREKGLAVRPDWLPSDELTDNGFDADKYLGDKPTITIVQKMTDSDIQAKCEMGHFYSSYSEKDLGATIEVIALRGVNGYSAFDKDNNRLFSVNADQHIEGYNSIDYCNKMIEENVDIIPERFSEDWRCAHVEFLMLLVQDMEMPHLLTFRGTACKKGKTLYSNLQKLLVPSKSPMYAAKITLESDENNNNNQQWWVPKSTHIEYLDDKETFDRAMDMYVLLKGEGKLE